jgi:hypothetical protein
LVHHSNSGLLLDAPTSFIDVAVPHWNKFGFTSSLIGKSADILAGKANWFIQKEH